MAMEQCLDMITLKQTSSIYLKCLLLLCLYASDGATLDMLQVGATGELQVTDVASRPGKTPLMTA